MKITSLPSSNGHDKAPHSSSGAFPSTQSSLRAPTARPATAFPQDVAIRSWRQIAYAMRHFQIGGTPFSRFVSGALVLVALVWSIGLWPGRWIGFAAALILLIGYQAFLFIARRDDFVGFLPATAPDTRSEGLGADEKIELHATGHFTVEGKYGRFTALPGFYRTFGSGEHAIMCLVRKRSFLGIATWPEEDFGMWYVFLEPDKIRRIRWGSLRFGSGLETAIAVDYELSIPSKRKNRSDKVVEETVYLAFATEENGLRVWTDLHDGVSLPATSPDISRQETVRSRRP